MTIAALSIHNVSKCFQDTPAVCDVSLSIEEGSFFSLLGPSGCGKSTLLRLIAGLECPDTGTICIHGHNVTKQKPYDRPVNMMFQSYALFPHMTVFDNVAYGLRQKKAVHVREQVLNFLSMVHMAHAYKKKPHQLSGGQQQRVALARCLVNKPKILLLDEPLAALDKDLRAHTQQELINIQRTLKTTFVMVTHDQEEAMAMSTQIAIMKDGKILQTGTPHKLYEAPCSQELAQFIGIMNFLKGHITSVENNTIVVFVHDLDTSIELQVSNASKYQVKQLVTLGIRPEKLLIHTTNPPQPCFKGKVENVYYHGTLSMYAVRVHNTIIKAPYIHNSRTPPPQIHSPVFLSYYKDSPLIFS